MGIIIFLQSFQYTLSTLTNFSEFIYFSIYVTIFAAECLKMIDRLCRILKQMQRFAYTCTL